MGLRDKLRRLERDAARGKQQESCPECGGRIIYAEHHEDGTVTYPLGEPCAICGSSPRIEVMYEDQ